MDNDEHVPTDDTLMAVLRKLEDGRFANKAGAALRLLMMDLRSLADRKGGSVKGKFTLTIDIPMSGKGNALPRAKFTTKAPEMAPEETVIFIDEDGDLISRPAGKQLEIPAVRAVADIEQQRKASV